MTPIEISIRPASESDAEIIFHGLKMIAAHLTLDHKVTTTVDDIRQHGFGPQPAFRALIADSGEQFAGMCIFFDSYATWSGRRGAYVQDLVVDPKFRGLGIGEKLLRETIAQVSVNGGEYVRLSVDAGNIQAQKFYEKMGLEWCREERIFAIRGDKWARIANTS